MKTRLQTATNYNRGSLPTIEQASLDKLDKSLADHGYSINPELENKLISNIQNGFQGEAASLDLDQILGIAKAPDIAQIKDMAKSLKMAHNPDSTDPSFDSTQGQKRRGTGFLHLPLELREMIYEHEFDALSLIRGYSLQLPFPTAYFASGDPFRFFLVSRQINGDWRHFLPIEENIEVSVESKPFDDYRRSNPLIKCETIVTPLEKCHSSQLTIYMQHELHLDACLARRNPHGSSASSTEPRTEDKTPNDVQNNRLVQTKHLLEYTERLFRNMRRVVFAGDFGAAEINNPPEKHSINVGANADINDIDPEKHLERLCKQGEMGHLTENRHFKGILNFIRNWQDSRVDTVGFTQGFLSMDPNDEEVIVARLQEEYGSEKLKFVIEPADEYEEAKQEGQGQVVGKGKQKAEDPA